MINFFADPDDDDQDEGGVRLDIPKFNTGGNSQLRNNTSPVSPSSASPGSDKSQAEILLDILSGKNRSSASPHARKESAFSVGTQAFGSVSPSVSPGERPKRSLGNTNLNYPHPEYVGTQKSVKEADQMMRIIKSAPGNSQRISLISTYGGHPVYTAAYPDYNQVPEYWTQGGPFPPPSAEVGSLTYERHQDGSHLVGPTFHTGRKIQFEDFFKKDSGAHAFKSDTSQADPGNTAADQLEKDTSPESQNSPESTKAGESNFPTLAGGSSPPSAGSKAPGTQSWAAMAAAAHQRSVKSGTTAAPAPSPSTTRSIKPETGTSVPSKNTSPPTERGSAARAPTWAQRVDSKA